MGSNAPLQRFPSHGEISGMPESRAVVKWSSTAEERTVVGLKNGVASQQVSPMKGQVGQADGKGQEPGFVARGKRKKERSTSEKGGRQDSEMTAHNVWQRPGHSSVIGNTSGEADGFVVQGSSVLSPAEERR